MWCFRVFFETIFSSSVTKKMRDWDEEVRKFFFLKHQTFFTRNKLKFSIKIFGFDFDVYRYFDAFAICWWNFLNSSHFWYWIVSHFLQLFSSVRCLRMKSTNLNQFLFITKMCEKWGEDMLLKFRKRFLIRGLVRWQECYYECWYPSYSLSTIRPQSTKIA